MTLVIALSSPDALEPLIKPYTKPRTLRGSYTTLTEVYSTAVMYTRKYLKETTLESV
jgi:hypothetical protein